MHTAEVLLMPTNQYKCSHHVIVDELRNLISVFFGFIY